MSYLQIPKGIPNFSKAVISLWFRGPKESVIAASKNKISSGLENFDMMQGVLPLITFGQPQTSKTYVTPTRNVAVIHPYIPGEPDADTTYNTIEYVRGKDYNVDPSYIGLSCNPDGTFYIVFHLQMKEYMHFSATTFVTTQMDIWSAADPAAPQDTSLGSGNVSLFPNVGTATIKDVSDTDALQPEFFEVISDKRDPDTWHHVLLSFDVSGTVSIGTPFASSTCKLWYAINDQDYRGAQNMQPYRDTGGQWGPDTLDPNTILTYYAWRYSGSDPEFEAIQYYENHYVGLPAGRCTFEPIPTGGIPTEDQPFGVPASGKYVDAVFNVEMAEFQMWTGVTLDTNVEANRRAFIDYERDSNGQPIKDKDGNYTLLPVEPVGQPPTDDHPDGQPAPAEKLLKKKPDILLHGSSNWIDGKNTGTTGLDYGKEPPKEKPDGQFQPKGKINPYRPNPSLSKFGSSTRRKAGSVHLTKKPADARL